MGYYAVNTTVESGLVSCFFKRGVVNPMVA
jgi:hypothetical protein